LERFFVTLCPLYGKYLSILGKSFIKNFMKQLGKYLTAFLVTLLLCVAAAWTLSAMRGSSPLEKRYHKLLAAPRPSAQELTALALEMAQAGLAGKSIRLFNRALALDPANFTALNGRGTAFYLRRDFDKALADFNSAALLPRPGPELYFNRAACLVLLGRLEDARKDLDSFIKINGVPGEMKADAFRRRAAIWATEGNFKNALGDLREGAALAKDNPGLTGEILAAAEILDRTRKTLE